MEVSEELLSTPLELTDLIEYQKDTIVSREIVKQDGGTITLFAVDAGQGISEHDAPFDAVVQVIDGEAIVTIDGEPNTVKKGQIIIMPANIMHALKADVSFKMVLTMIKKL